jgi:hypothetical protein
VARHGTKYSYSMGCRCDKCREAARKAHREWRDRQRAANSPAYRRELGYSRRLKESYRGSCRECGASTTGCNGPGTAPLLCYRCSAKVVGKAQIGTGPMQKRLFAFLKKERGWSEIRDHLGVSNGYTAAMLDRNLRNGTIVKISRGRYILATPKQAT